LDDNIDLMKYVKLIWANKGKVFLFAGIGLIIGLIVAFTTPNEYTATTVMVPQMSGKTPSANGLSGLAAMAGIDLSNMGQSNEMSPIVYPQIVNSTPFKLELMHTPLKFDKYDKPISLYEYYERDTIPTFFGTIKKYTLGLPRVIIGAIKGKKSQPVISENFRNDLIQLTEMQYNVSKVLDGIVSLEVQTKEGYLTLTVVMPEPLVAAQLAQKAQELLQREITNYKVQKAKAELDFIQERYNEAEAKAEGFQVNIAQKNDQYKNLVSSVPQVQSARIQTKYGIASSVFQDLAKQLEQAKIQVKKDTPTFTIIEPVTIPNEKSGISKIAILLVCGFLGVLVGVVLVLLIPAIKEVKSRLNDAKEIFEDKEVIV
jgi:LPS O-antigen subunit length determinant protein (WzzB/FepE family)